MLYALISKLIIILFPPSCFICHKEKNSLCTSCLQHCKKSLTTQSLYSTSVYNFQDQSIKKIIHAIKYFHRRDLIAPLVTALAVELQKNIDTNKQNSLEWVLVPIPMPLLRKYTRGYNQAELIAQELSKQCSLSYSTKILRRLGSHKRQVTTTTKSERIKNQHNSFEVVGNVQGLHIILVDDVTTTGATINEARKTLIHAGAKNVIAATLAH